MTASILSWDHSDFEQKLFFRGGRFTRVNNTLSLILAVGLTVSFYAAMTLLPENPIGRRMVGQGPIPYAIVFASSFCLAILGVKALKLRLQRKALQLPLLEDPHFVLSPATARLVNDRMFLLVDKPQQFLVLNRIQLALSNLRNIGRVADVDEILRSQADADEQLVENSYLLIRNLIWAIPMLGFIGTVVGLSIAIGEFGSVISASGDSSQILPALKDVTGGLGIAFDTTLEALLAALTIQLLTGLLHRAELDFLSSCSEFCTSNVTNRLRLLAVEPQTEAESGHA